MTYPPSYALLVASAAILGVFTAFSPSVPLLCAVAFLAGAAITLMIGDAIEVGRMRRSRQRITHIAP